MNKPAAPARIRPAPTQPPSLLALVGAAHQLEQRIESELHNVGLSMPKFGVLDALAAQGTPLALSELAARIRCVRSNVTQLVDRLEDDGLVRRTAAPGDRRSVLATMTATGRQRHAEGAAVVDRLQREFSNELGDSRDALAQVLAALG
jgi:DNA-binding MarR family transcriptional regulator